MGAKRLAIVKLMLYEASFISALGAVIGLSAGSSIFLVFRGEITGPFEKLFLPFSWQSPESMLLLGASYPALSAAREDPHSAILS